MDSYLQTAGKALNLVHENLVNKIPPSSSAPPPHEPFSKAVTQYHNLSGANKDIHKRIHTHELSESFKNCKDLRTSPEVVPPQTDRLYTIHHTSWIQDLYMDHERFIYALDARDDIVSFAPTGEAMLTTFTAADEMAATHGLIATHSRGRISFYAADKGILTFQGAFTVPPLLHSMCFGKGTQLYTMHGPSFHPNIPNSRHIYKWKRGQSIMAPVLTTSLKDLKFLGRQSDGDLLCLQWHFHPMPSYVLTTPLNPQPQNPIIDNYFVQSKYVMDNASGHECLLGLSNLRPNVLLEFNLQNNTRDEIRVRGLPPNMTGMAIGAKGFCFAVSSGRDIHVFKTPNAMRTHG